MNSIVSIVAGGDKVFGIKQNISTVGDVLCGDGIHVMNENPAVNIETFRAEVAAVVAEDNEVAHWLPFFWTVKDLVQISVKAEGFTTDFAAEL